MENGLKGWDDSKSFEENIKPFGWTPGIAFRPEREAQLRELLKDHPRREQVVAAIKEVHEWLRDGGTQILLAKSSFISPDMIIAVQQAA